MSLDENVTVDLRQPTAADLAEKQQAAARKAQMENVAKEALNQIVSSVYARRAADIVRGSDPDYRRKLSAAADCAIEAGLVFGREVMGIDCRRGPTSD